MFAFVISQTSAFQCSRDRVEWDDWFCRRSLFVTQLHVEQIWLENANGSAEGGRGRGRAFAF